MSIDNRRRIGLTEVQTDGKLEMPRRERVRLRALRYRIDELERLLANEFATQATAPVLDELTILQGEQDALLARFVDPAPNQRR